MPQPAWDVPPQVHLLPLHEALADFVARSQALARVLGAMGGAPAALAAELDRRAHGVEAASRGLVALGDEARAAH